MNHRGKPIFGVARFYQGSSQCFFRRPSRPDSLCDQSGVHAKLSCPLRNIERPSFVGQFSVATRVISLLKVTSPTRVLGGVAEIVVQSLYGKPCLIRWSHIRQEVLERISPTVADCDTATPVIPEVPVTLIVAPTPHGEPHAVNVTFREPVSPIACSSYLVAQTTATSSWGISAPQAPSVHFNRLAAIALAEPSGSPTLVSWCWAQCYEATKSLAGYISRGLAVLSRASYNVIRHGLLLVQIQDRVMGDRRLHPLVALTILPYLRKRRQPYFGVI